MANRRVYTMGARAESLSASRERIAQACLKLLLERAYEDVTLDAIASAAGVSHQTLFNHFGSKEGVALAAVEILSRETGEARSKATVGDSTSAVRVLVGDYERIGDANARWAMSAERLGSLAGLLTEARAGHQRWLARIFRDSLPPGRGERRRMISALHAATDVYTWKLLRRDLNLSRAETESSMIALVDGVLGGGGRGARPATATRTGGAT